MDCEIELFCLWKRKSIDHSLTPLIFGTDQEIKAFFDEVGKHIIGGIAPVSNKDSSRCQVARIPAHHVRKSPEFTLAMPCLDESIGIGSVIEVV